MFMTKMKVAATLLLIAVVVGGGAGVVTYQGLAAQPPNQQVKRMPNRVAQAKPKTHQEIDEERDKEIERLQNLETLFTPKDKLKAIIDASNYGEKMKSLLKARLDAANTEVNARWKEYCVGRGNLDHLVNSSQRLLEAERDLSSDKAHQVAAWESHWRRMHQTYLINLARYNAGRIGTMDLAQSDYYRLDAEIGLERAKAQLMQSRKSS